MEKFVAWALPWWLASVMFCFVAVFWSFWPMLDVPPWEHQSILVFEHGAQNGLLDFDAVGQAAGLRFLVYYSFVLHVKTTGYAMLPVQLVNIASIALALIAAAAYARYLLGRVEALIIVPLLFFGCFIWWQTVEWTPSRQDTFVLIFAGWALAFFHAKPRAGTLGLIGVGILLISAGLSKETGVVAMAYMVLIGAVDHERRAYVIPALISLVLIVGLREFYITSYEAPGTIKCETMSFLFSIRETCTTFNFLDLKNVLQIAWNVFLGVYLAIVPPLFDRWLPMVFEDSSGHIISSAFGSRYAAYALACIALVIIACVSRPKLTLSALLLVMLNAGIGVAFWRLRNMGLGLTGGLAILTLGFLSLVDWTSSHLSPRPSWGLAVGSGMTLALIVALGILNVPQATRFQAISESERDRRTTAGPDYVCTEARKVLTRPTRYDPDYVIDPVIVGDIVRAWGIDPAQCTADP